MHVNICRIMHESMADRSPGSSVSHLFAHRESLIIRAGQKLVNRTSCTNIPPHLTPAASDSKISYQSLN